MSGDFSPLSPAPACAGDPALEPVRAALTRASFQRALSFLFAPPRPRLGAELEGLAVTLPGALREELLALARAVPADLETTYHRLLGPGGACPPCESDWSSNQVGAKGGLLGDVAGFYKAFRFDPTREMKDAPDHVAIEAAFASWLEFKLAYALAEGRAEEAETCEGALASFRAEHLDPLLAALEERLGSAAPGSFHAAAARFARGGLEAWAPRPASTAPPGARPVEKHLDPIRN